MFFDSPEEIERIAKRTGTAIFVMPKTVDFAIKNALILQPEDKTTITIEQVRDEIARLAVKQVGDRYIIIRPADALGEEAANAFLKNLEEPGDKVHFILVTESPSRLLPTILSRAEIYFMRQKWSAEGGITADAKVKDLAKKLMVAKPGELPAIADEICKKKDGVRAYALEVLSAAIEMLYKSYIITRKDAFLKKLPRFLEAYEAISRNGHIKLHLVADLC